MSDEVFSYVRDAFELLREEVELVLVGVVYNPAGSIDVEYTATVRTPDDNIYWKVDYYHNDTVVVTQYVQSGEVTLEAEEGGI